MVSNGFIMSTSKDEVEDEEVFLRRTQIITNEFGDLLFRKVQDRYPGKEQYINIISGMLFRTFSAVDMFELKGIFDALKRRQHIPEIDMEAIVSNYDGHTIFSIFQSEVQVYEQILKQLTEKDWPESEDFNGNEVENGYLRRLHRTLLTPTADWKDSEEERKALIASQEAQLEKKTPIKRFAHWVRMTFGVGDEALEGGGLGFKSVRQKSLYFPRSRFRENLIEISMLC